MLQPLLELDWRGMIDLECSEGLGSRITGGGCGGGGRTMALEVSAE